MDTLTKLTKARMAIMRVPERVPYAICLLGMEWKKLPNGQTMATDGKFLYYSEDFVQSITMTELIAVLVHEALHVLLHHQFRLRGRDKQVANMAADYVVNLMLAEEQLILPQGCLMDRRFKGLNMEQVYDYLIKHSVPPPPQDLPGGLSEPKDGEGDELSDQELKEAFQEAKESVTQINMTAEKIGKMPGGLGKAINAAMTEAADWGSILAEFVDSHARADYSMARINRRALGRGLILPGLQSEDIGKILVVLDTSGSTISRPCLNEFLAQLFHIVDQYPDTGIQIVCCDTEPVLIGEYEAGDLPEPSELKLVGGGGTSLQKLEAFVERNDLFPTLAIYFTDCELDEWGNELEFPLLVASDSYPQPYYPMPDWIDQFVKLQ